MKKRGFEKISLKQFESDLKDLTKEDNLYESIILPKRATKNSAGYDFYSPYFFELKPNEIIIIPTGIKVYMKQDEYLAIIGRSSVGFKYNVRLCNQVGVIDSDYYNNPKNEGHILVALQNEGKEPWIVQKGGKIAQGVFQKYLTVDNEDVVFHERSGGIGSTGEGEK